jgi:hypothetical protein
VAIGRGLRHRIHADRAAGRVDDDYADRLGRKDLRRDQRRKGNSQDQKHGVREHGATLASTALTLAGLWN